MGNLVIKNNIAENDFLSKKIIPPGPTVTFSDDEEPAASGLIKFIAHNKNTSVDNATVELQQYVDHIKSTLSANLSYSLPAIGELSMTTGGKFLFKEHVLPQFYLPVIPAERIVHPEAEHAILVGDKESTNTAMADYYNEEEPVKKSQWWIWAVLLLCIAIVIVLTYFNSANNASMLGNCTSIF